ncbi:MAG: hypothetical protein HOE55_07920 [Thiotrichales bacterium]|nr:hypothetical protein [Thiotrichales bacterium]MBT4152959.1 hypothetical protein [Thiotrichales bacterium]
MLETEVAKLNEVLRGAKKKHLIEALRMACCLVADLKYRNDLCSEEVVTKGYKFMRESLEPMVEEYY